MSYTHNEGFSATKSGYAIGAKGNETQIIDGEGNITLPSGKVLTGSVAGNLKTAAISKADSYALSDSEKLNQLILLTQTGDGKTFTLGLSAGSAVLVYNAGAKAFTLKNVSDDTGQSVAAGKVYLVVASATANQSTFVLLNDGTE